MVQFRQGMLGVAVVAVAIAGALLGSWAMSMDVEERTVTTYSPLSDITPLFDSELAPTFTDYNPTTNYTGYYTSETVVDDTIYFGGVDFTKATRPNNFKLDLPPIDSVSSTYDLSLNPGDSGDWKFFYWTDNDDLNRNQVVGHASLSNLLGDLGLSNYNQITIISQGSNLSTGGFVTFATTSMLNKIFHPVNNDEKTVAMKLPSLTGDLEAGAAVTTYIDSTRVDNPVLACRYNSTIQAVELFADVEMSQSLGVSTPADVYVLWSTSESSDFHLGHMVDVEGVLLPASVYMDPSGGVKVES